MIGDLIMKIVAYGLVGILLIGLIMKIWEGITDFYEKFVIRQKYRKLKDELLRLPIEAFNKVVRREESASLSAWETKLFIDRLISSADEYSLEEIQKRLRSYRQQRD